jgi:hypothetical protein
MRRLIIALVLLGCGLLPVLIGATCAVNTLPTNVIPPPTGGAQTVVPACFSGFVCVNLANAATVPVKMALYVHNGYDPNNQFALTPDFSCCTNPNSTTACTCPCPGRDTGNCQLNFLQIFLPQNIRPVNGNQQVTLVPNQAIFQQIRCEQVKTLGAAVAPATGDAILAPVDQNGPVYRTTTSFAATGGVACGQTVQFQATDQNQTGAGNGGGDLATLIIATQFSR